MALGFARFREHIAAFTLKTKQATHRRLTNTTMLRRARIGGFVYIFVVFYNAVPPIH